MPRHGRGLLDAYAGIEFGGRGCRVGSSESTLRYAYCGTGAGQEEEQERLRLIVDPVEILGAKLRRARLASGEDERPRNEKRVLANAEKI